jgi:AcrR family transcriptional regulator
MPSAASAHDAERASSDLRSKRRRFRTPSLHEQILAATANVVAAEGYEQASVEAICALVGIPPQRFFEHFESKRAAVIVAVEEFADRVIGDCRDAAVAAKSWPEGIWAASTVFTDWGACEPCFARLGIVEIAGAGRPGQVLMGELLTAFATFLHPSSSETHAERELKMGMEMEMGMGMDSRDKEIGERLLALLHEHIVRYSAKTLQRIAPDLTRIALAPFIGDAEAERFVAKRLAEERQ